MGRASTVLVVTGAEDRTGEAVAAQLRKRDATVVRIDIGDFPLRLGIAATITGRSWQGQLTTPDTTVELDEIRSVYYRRPTQFVFPERMSKPDRMLAAAEARHGLGGTLAALDALWVNDPSLTARANYKPLGLKVAAQCGLNVPPTLVTSDYAAAAAFAGAHAPVVCKPLSSVVLGNPDGRPLISYTTLVDVDAVDPGQFATTTNMLQRWVPKDMDCRITMVGEQPYAALVKAGSPAGHIDWRTDYPSLTYSPSAVPAGVTDGMVRYLEAFGLHFAAFDFGIDHDGRWWFYEANANGEWLWIETETGLPISAAIADLLIEEKTP